MKSSNGLTRRGPNRAQSSLEMDRPPFDYESPLLDRLFNSSIGFDEMFHRIFENVPKKLDAYPPYNLFKYDSGYMLEMAVAGFSIDDISIYIENGYLVIEGKQPSATKEEQETQGKSIMHHGLARRGFKQVLKISNLIVVQEARLENGMLRVSLNEVEPDPPDREYIKIE